ncbi:hypothetical protein [Novosphingobium sp. EMRT-2]|uniref:hypothetical protein n=1 Tax=Novosphingobium sp. EMRT-2 TaxID=2571749 RepID=UPI0010BDFDF5|nr:hypothetical protein [Novosphingobium sp. EMRT-2]QCI92601.1 hypothetical protein FA702_02875 [Novosphingobium sp. EMRT-2]
MTKFTLPKRVDADLAISGVDFNIQDEHGQEWGTYKLAWVDTESQRGRAKLLRYDKRYKSQRKAKATNKEMLDIDYEVRCLAENYLLDWTLPKEMTGGKILPFSPEAAIELLSMPETLWLANTLINKARDITNFNVITDADGESVTPEKN